MTKTSSATLPPSAPQPVDAERRCKVTGNLCGTDTWAADRPCLCSECQAWLAASPTPAQQQFDEAQRSLAAMEPWRRDEVRREVGAAAPPGDMARKMAEAVFKGLEEGVPLGRGIEYIASILQRHLPQRLSEEERRCVDRAWIAIGRDPKHHHANSLGGTRAARLLAIIDRLTTPAAEDEKK